MKELIVIIKSRFFCNFIFDEISHRGLINKEYPIKIIDIYIILVDEITETMPIVKIKLPIMIKLLFLKNLYEKVWEKIQTIKIMILITRRL